MKIDFYYWGNMCPISAEILDLIHRYKSKVNINTYEISNDLSVSKNKKIFFPFLTVINDVNRYYAPINKKFMDQVASGIIPVEKPYIPELGTESVAKTIKPITEENYNIASQCTSRINCLGCSSKIKMYDSINEDVYGFMNLSGNKLLGGAEFVPSNLVPYDIPRSEDIAFITCIYLSNKDYDYKSAPLMALEDYLKNKYKEVLVISDEIGVFPNGNLEFFLKNNYKDEAIVFEDDYCKLHLMSKILWFTILSLLNFARNRYLWTEAYIFRTNALG